jgi:hypothetical protein
MAEDTRHPDPYAFFCRSCKKLSDLDDPTAFQCPLCGSEAGVWGPKSKLAPLEEEEEQ